MAFRAPEAFVENALTLGSWTRLRNYKERASPDLIDRHADDRFDGR
jgi:hypothetical protein